MAGVSRRQMLAAGLSWQAVAGLGWAAPVEPAQGAKLMAGWREAILVVPDTAPWIEVLTTVGGWELAHSAGPDASLNALWSLPPAARVRQVLMRDIGTRSGYLRLVQVSGVEQHRIRPDDQAWETGGVQALDLRVLDLEATRVALDARGWRASSDPVRYEAYAGIEVIQWAPSSPDGVRLSFIQRIAPPLTGWPELKRWARAMNAAITVKDVETSRRFFDALGLEVAARSHAVGEGGPNVMGLPWAFQRTLPVEIVGLKGATPGDSSVELISMPQAQGRDYAQAAHPPNLGIAALRFMVADATGLAAALQARGTPLAAPVQEVVIAPYGRCRALCVRAPDGVWLEFVQPSG